MSIEQWSGVAVIIVSIKVFHCAVFSLVCVPLCYAVCCTCFSSAVWANGITGENLSLSCLCRPLGTSEIVDANSDFGIGFGAQSLRRKLSIVFLSANDIFWFILMRLVKNSTPTKQSVVTSQQIIGALPHTPYP